MSENLILNRLKGVHERFDEVAILITQPETISDMKRYIKLNKDKGLSVQLQDKMIKNLNAQKVVTLDSGHLPMISKPKELSEILNNFINEIN